MKRLENIFTVILLSEVVVRLFGGYLGPDSGFGKIPKLPKRKSLERIITVLITGANLSNYENVQNILRDILEYAGEKYPMIEAMKNDNNFYCLVLKPKE